MPDSATVTRRPRSHTKPNLARFISAMDGVDATTPVQIATLLGFDVTTIRRLLSGDLNVSFDMMQALNRVVGLHEAAVICGLVDES